MLPPAFGRWSIGAIGVTLFGLAATVATRGGSIFSPGPLRGQDSTTVVLGGVTSHAGLAHRCSACHAPILSTRGMNARCLDCHTDIQKDLDDSTALHGRLSGASCRACHTEHRGDTAGLTLAVIDHDLLRFPLRGAHSHVTCARCHGSASTVAEFKTAPTTCIGCHRDDDEHHGRFGEDCSTCHGVQTWVGARIRHDEFPLDHGRHGGTASECATCHQNRDDYRQYTCYGCHEHSPDRVRAEHAEEGVATTLDDCVRCHRGGSEHGERDERRGEGRREREH